MTTPSTWSYDRPRFLVVVISALTSTRYVLSGVDSWSFNKTDDGSSGTFTISLPMRAPYDDIIANASARDQPLPQTQVYAQTAAPMDLIALYAQRASVNDTTTSTPMPSIMPPGFGSLFWGDTHTASVTALGTDNCIFIGMLDGAHVSGSPGAAMTLTLTGRDLTKIFEVNYTGIPTTVASAIAIDSKDFLNFNDLPLSYAKSGADFLTQVLDFLCAKEAGSLFSLLPGDTPILKTLSSGTAGASFAVNLYHSFGFPWRNFVRTDVLDPKYHNLTHPFYAPYTPQLGPVWSSIMELRNAPISRLFVNEIGQLIYDDAYGAWTGVNLDGTIPPKTYPYANLAGTILADEVRDFEFGFDDSTMVTFLSVIGNVGTGSGGTADATMQRIFGVYEPGSEFLVNGGMTQSYNVSDAHIGTFGYRYAQFESQWDLNLADALKRQKVVIASYNNLTTASVTLRGNAKYRVGQRWRLMLDAQRPDMSNTTWYVHSIRQEGTWGEDWTTSLELRYPPAVATSAPAANLGGFDNLSPGTVG